MTYLIIQQIPWFAISTSFAAVPYFVLSNVSHDPPWVKLAALAITIMALTSVWIVIAWAILQYNSIGNKGKNTHVALEKGILLHRKY